MLSIVTVYPSLAVSGESVLQQSLDVLKQLHYDWPMSKRWEDTLSRMTSALSAMGSSPPTTFTSWENGVVAYVSIGCSYCVMLCTELRI